MNKSEPGKVGSTFQTEGTAGSKTGGPTRAQSAIRESSVSGWGGGYDGRDVRLRNLGFILWAVVNSERVSAEEQCGQIYISETSLW